MVDKTITILAVGAAGHFAGLVVPALSSRGARVRGLVLKPEDGEMVRRNGATEVAVGDLADRESIDKALEGIDAVFYIAPEFNDDEAKVGVDFVQACKDAGVRRFVFSSVLHPTITAIRNHSAKAPVEAAIVESGMEYTILQLAMFYQNMVAAWPAILKSRTLAEPFLSTARLARVDYRDVAEVAAIALTEDRLRNGTFELCGDDEPNREDVARIISDVLGRPIQAVTPSFSEWAATAKVSPEKMQSEGAMFAYYGLYGSPGNPFALRAILGREPRSLRQFFVELAAGEKTVAA